MSTHPFPAVSTPNVFAPVARRRLLTRARVINIISVAVLLAVGVASIAMSHHHRHTFSGPRQAAIAAKK